MCRHNQYSNENNSECGHAQCRMHSWYFNVLMLKSANRVNVRHFAVIGLVQVCSPECEGFPVVSQDCSSHVASANSVSWFVYRSRVCFTHVP